MKYIALLLLLSGCGTLDCRENTKWVRCINDGIVYDDLAVENSCTSGNFLSCSVVGACWLTNVHHKTVVIPGKSKCKWYDAKPQDPNHE